MIPIQSNHNLMAKSFIRAATVKERSRRHQNNLNLFKKKVGILPIFLVFILSSCTTTSQKTLENPNTPAPMIISGAIAARNQHQGWTATFYWTQHSPKEYQIFINGPVGSTAIDVTMKDGIVTYREGKKVIRTRQAEALFAKETGIHLPINHLYYWIKGQPAPGPIAAISRSDQHDILRLKQAGFTLDYADYHNHYPHKIRLTKQQLLIKIAIKS